MHFSANMHVNKPVVLARGANESTIIVALDDGTKFNSPIAYIYLPNQYASAVDAAIVAFNEAFRAALDEPRIEEAAE